MARSGQLAAASRAPTSYSVGSSATETKPWPSGWVRVATRPALAMPADDPWAAIADRLAAQFGELIDALAAGDSARAGSYWVALLDANAPFVESTGFAGRLMIDVID